MCLQGHQWLQKVNAKAHNFGKHEVHQPVGFAMLLQLVYALPQYQAIHANAGMPHAHTFDTSSCTGVLHVAAAQQ